MAKKKALVLAQKLSVTDRLADVVEQRIRQDHEEPLEREFVGITPSLEVLEDLFRTLFFASLKTEEGRPIQARIFYIDPENRIHSHLRGFARTAGAPFASSKRWSSTL